jgi:hypothetical protein
VDYIVDGARHTLTANVAAVVLGKDLDAVFTDAVELRKA